MDAPRRKLTVVGDDRCGKTCLLFALRHEPLPTSYEPTLFDTYSTDTEVDGKEMKLILFDVAGKNEFSYQNLRSVFYKDTDVILMCFSVDRPNSQQNILDFWLPEIKQFCPTVPIILVATKIELRGDESIKKKLSTPGNKPFNTTEGKALAARIGAYAYLECSAKTKEALAGRRHEVKGMPTTTLSALQVINNLERLRHAVNLSRKSQRGTEMDRNGKMHLHTLPFAEALIVGSAKN